MKKLLAVLMLTFVTSIAHAVNYGSPGNNPGNPSNPGIGGPPVTNPGNGNPPAGDVTVTNDLAQKVTVVTTSVNNSASLSASKSLSNSNASSNATGGTATATGGSAETTSTSSSGGNTQNVGGANQTVGGANQSVNIGGDSGNRKYSGSYTVRGVGIAPDIVASPTAPCRVAVGVSGGWIGGALGLTGSTLDEGCDARADATMLVMMGYEGAAAARLCQKPEMAKALGPVICPTQKEQASVSSNNSMFTH